MLVEKVKIIQEVKIMSLKKCQECGHEVSSSAAQCPNCGAYVNNSKTVIWITLFVVLIVFAVVLYYAWHNSPDQQIKRMNEGIRKSMDRGFKFELGPVNMQNFTFSQYLTG